MCVGGVNVSFSLHIRSIPRFCHAPPMESVTGCCCLLPAPVRAQILARMQARRHLPHRAWRCSGRWRTCWPCAGEGAFTCFLSDDFCSFLFELLRSHSFFLGHSHKAVSVPAGSSVPGINIPGLDVRVPRVPLVSSRLGVSAVRALAAVASRGEHDAHVIDDLAAVLTHQLRNACVFLEVEHFLAFAFIFPLERIRHVLCGWCASSLFVFVRDGLDAHVHSRAIIAATMRAVADVAIHRPALAAEVCLRETYFD